MEKWICSCGAENNGKFCGVCGQAKPIDVPYTEVVESPDANGNFDRTMEIPVVSQNTPFYGNDNGQIQQPQGMYNQPFPGQGGYDGYGQPPKSFVDRVGKVPLIAVGAVLVAAIIGLIVYFTSVESRYLGKVAEADQVVTEVQTVLTEIRNQNGDPDAEATKNYINKVNDVKGKLDKSYNDISGARPGKKYQEYNAKLVEALGLEKQILQKVADTLANTPDNISSAASMDGGFQVDIQKLSVMAPDVNLENTHFGTTMKLDALGADMNTYLQKFHAVAVQKRIEAERKRRQDALNRLNTFRQKMRSNLYDRRSESRGKYTYLATDVYPEGSSLVVDGEIYNGESKSYTGFNNYSVTVTLYNEGNQVYQTSGKRSGYTGNVYGGGSRNYKFWFHGDDIRDVVYDSFEVSFS